MRCRSGEVVRSRGTDVVGESGWSPSPAWCVAETGTRTHISQQSETSINDVTAAIHGIQTRSAECEVFTIKAGFTRSSLTFA